MSSDITATDLFCGAGGSSTGLVKAGIRVQMAANHWQLAIETHATNHPETDHDCADIQQAHPSWYPKTTMLWASPSCTNHSLAKGRKRKAAHQMGLWGENKIDPAEERSRATMREVVEFTEYHRYEFVIVENVVDIRHWAYYEDWLTAMVNLGYNFKTLYLNSQFFGVPQSRDRWYTVFWKKGNKRPDLDFRPAAYCEKHGYVLSIQSWKKPDFPWGRYGERRQYLYRCPHCGGVVEPPTTPAALAIGWSIPAPKIGDRKRPLKPKTIERIKAGLEKFARKAVVVDLGHTHASHSGKVKSHEDPLPTQTTTNNLSLALPPFLTVLKGPLDAISVDDPLTTIVASASQHYLTTPPFLMQYYSRNNAQSSLDDPIPVITTEKRHALVVPPFLMPLRRGATAKGVDEPMHSITAGGGHHALIMAYYGSNPVFGRVDEDPLPGITTVQRHALIEPDELINETGFRMLKSHELAKGMSFPDDYIILGNQRDRVRQIGNAVTPNVAEWIAQRCVASLA